MTFLIKHIASGEAFFTGVALLSLSALLMRRSSGSRWATIPWAVGLLLIGASATPLPTSFYVIAVTLSVGWIVTVSMMLRRAKKSDPNTDRATNPRWPRWANGLTALFLLVWFIGAALELPCHLMPNLPPASVARLTIFADSVTAGIGEREAITWPQLIAAAHPIDVVDHSRMGATAASATLLAQQHPPQPGIVLLEIGGNDVLGSTTAAEFERTLNELLQTVSASDRQVVLLELPLPPLFTEYGRIQRRLAKQYDVRLIPRRFLLDVLLSEATTLDSIHLSQAGHQRMADQMWELLEPSY